jgi:hypothetical protein
LYKQLLEESYPRKPIHLVISSENEIFTLLMTPQDFSMERVPITQIQERTIKKNDSKEQNSRPKENET